MTPLEEMLVQQAMWAHARTAHLSSYTTNNSDLDAVDRLSAAAERVSNTFRKQMLGLAAYRRTPRPAPNVTSIRQANIAHQQVVQNPPLEAPTDEIKKIATNKQGLSHAHRIP